MVVKNKNQDRIDPSKVTKPIQLLAAWLVGLILVNGSFLTTSTLLEKSGWLSAILIISSIANVPLFLISIFLLQTKFRPEMQEDIYYSKYIDKKFGSTQREITPYSLESLKNQNKFSNQELNYKISFLENSVLDLTSQLEKVKEINSVLNLDEIRKKLESKEATSIISTILSDKTISVNKCLSNFKEINDSLKEFNLPIHELFGTEEPSNFAVLFGNGFSEIELQTILRSIIKVSDGLVSYAEDEFEFNQYDKTVLIGAYTVSRGILISEFLDIVEGRNLSTFELYRLLGK